MSLWYSKLADKSSKFTNYLSLLLTDQGLAELISKPTTFENDLLYISLHKC